MAHFLKMTLLEKMADVSTLRKKGQLDHDIMLTTVESDSNPKTVTLLRANASVICLKCTTSMSLIVYTPED